MNKKLLLSLLLIFTIGSFYAQGSLWTRSAESRIAQSRKMERTSTPNEADFYSLDFSGMKSILKSAPNRDFSALTSSTIVSFPNANGKLEQFRIYESSVMAPELAAKHASIQSYIGQGIDNSNARIYLTTTIFGFHGMVLSAKGTYYIDPIATDQKQYIVYNKSSLKSSKPWTCYNENDMAEEMQVTSTAVVSDGLFRTYRMAMACTIEYSNFHVNAAINAGALSSTATIAQRKAAVLAAMNVTISRINSVYETDMSLRMKLVANNEDIIFIDSDSFDNDNANTLINQSQTIIDGTIGSANYDIGHTVSTGGGGLAALGSVCTNSKARGITGSRAPVGDPFDIDFVAHEVGHQFGGSHTFNNSCGSNRARDSAAASVEPGSGSTIMAYAGICPSNIQANSDTYFHAISIAEMTNHINSNGNCVVGVSNANLPPVIVSLSNFTIPRGTPFALNATVTDDSSTALTYCWEQTNSGVSTALPSATSTESNPNFRSFTPSISSVRYFPALENILVGDLTSMWEVIPSVARTMNFALTARDNNVSRGGQTSRANTVVNFSGIAGPFKVTSQMTQNTLWLPNQTQTISWDVAGTDLAPINSTNVKILLSIDGGLTYDIVLIASTPNDGSQAITVPNINAPFCRIMVQPVGNIYFAINSVSFAIGQFKTECVVYNNRNTTAIPDGLANGSSGGIVSSIINVPDNYTITDVKIALNITHPYISDLVVSLRHPDNASVRLINRICEAENGINATVRDGAQPVVCTNPVTNEFAPNQPLNALRNKPSAGDWKLDLQDLAQFDTGILNSWSVEICYSVNLAAEQFELKDLIIAPNPNSGNFSVSFNSASGEPIFIKIYDISGRQIFDRLYTNEGVFAQNIQLDNVQAGVYLVNIQDGNQKSVRKIVIQ